MPRNKVKKSSKTTRESDESPVHRNSDRSDNEPQAPENRKITSRASSASVPADIEQRVADALADAQGNTWRGLICAVNGVPVESNPVQVWRLIPSALEEDTESQKIGMVMEHGPAKSGSRHTFQYAATLGYFFDRVVGPLPTGWFWLPADKDLLDKMFAEYCVNNKTPSEGNKKQRISPSEFYESKTAFDYNITPFPELQGAVAFCQYTEMGENGILNVEHHIQHQYPFKTRNPVTLHVAPHFAIFNAGEKLAKRLSTAGTVDHTSELAIADKFGAMLNTFSTATVTAMAKVYLLYRAWTQVAPPATWNQSLDQGSSDQPAPGIPGPSTRGSARKKEMRRQNFYGT